MSRAVMDMYAFPAFMDWIDIMMQEVYDVDD